MGDYNSLEITLLDRIGELKDSSLVARKLAPDNRIMCASPKYLQERGAPKRLEELEFHNCLSANAQEGWRLDGPDGQKTIKVKGNIRTNSSEFVREALLSGLGIGLRSTWDIADELKSGKLQFILPEYRGSSAVAVYAVYPCREFMPAKVNVFIEFLAELYGNEPYWERGLDLTKLPADSEGRKEVKRKISAVG